MSDSQKDLHKHKYYEQRLWPNWIERTVGPRPGLKWGFQRILGEVPTVDREREQRPVLFVPGFMMSTLWDARRQQTLWFDPRVFVFPSKLVRLGFKEPRLNSSYDRVDNYIMARAPMRSWLVLSPGYRNFLKFLRPGVFSYDWRDRIETEAKRLKLFFDELLDYDGEDSIDKVDLVTHSLGGCVVLKFLQDNFLQDNKKLTDRIGKIIFIAPPFRGLLSAISTIQDGKTTIPLLNCLLSDKKMRDISTTMPGMYQVMPAPVEQWLKQLPMNGGTLDLVYPVRGGDLYDPTLWKSRLKNKKPRKGHAEKIWAPNKDCLKWAKAWHEDLDLKLDFADEALKKRMFLIVGIGSPKTGSSVRQRNGGGWKISRQAEPGPGRLHNGDGMVLFESSYLPLPDPDHQIWALEAIKNQDLHDDMIGNPEVLAAIEKIRAEGTAEGTGLTKYTEFVSRIYPASATP